MPKREDLIQTLFENTVFNASKKLSSFLSQRIELEDTGSRVINLAQLAESIGQEERIFTVLAMKIQKGIFGTFILLLDKKSQDLLEQSLITNYHLNDSSANSLRVEALKEMGNIFLGSLLAEISKATHINTSYSVPGIATDMLKASLDEITAELLLDEQNGFLYESDIAINPLGIRMKLMLVLREKSLDGILKESAKNAQ